VVVEWQGQPDPPVPDLEFSRLESWSRDSFLQVLVWILVLNLGVLVLEPQSLGLGLGLEIAESWS